MKFSNSTSRQEDRAARWAAKIDGASLSSADRTELEAWLAEDPRHRTLLSEYCQFSADLEWQLPQLVEMEGAAMPPECSTVRRPFLRPLLVMGSLAAAALITAGVWVAHPREQTQTVATAVAERKTIELADGSVVELNARTNLLVDFRSKERHVRLADGEAFFTVAKNAARPFIVETPAGSVRVTGTVFDVHADDTSSMAVTVVEGSVQVSPGASPSGHASAPVALKAQDQLVTVSESGERRLRKLETGELEDALAWRHGEAVFDQTPLATALAQYARYHGRTINADRAVANLHVSGRYRLDDLDEFLNALPAILPLQVSTDSSGAINVQPRTDG